VVPNSKLAGSIITKSAPNAPCGETRCKKMNFCDRFLQTDIAGSPNVRGARVHRKTQPISRFWPNDCCKAPALAYKTVRFCLVPLYMARVAGVRSNPTIRAFDLRLRGNGKQAKPALTHAQVTRYSQCDASKEHSLANTRAHLFPFSPPGGGV
jgi:hypothetical protein